jgi:hypothetical protein
MVAISFSFSISHPLDCFTRASGELWDKITDILRRHWTVTSSSLYLCLPIPQDPNTKVKLFHKPKIHSSASGVQLHRYEQEEANNNPQFRLVFLTSNVLQSCSWSSWMIHVPNFMFMSCGFSTKTALV